MLTKITSVISFSPIRAFRVISCSKGYSMATKQHEKSNHNPQQHEYGSPGSSGENQGVSGQKYRSVTKGSGYGKVEDQVNDPAYEETQTWSKHMFEGKSKDEKSVGYDAVKEGTVKLKKAPGLESNAESKYATQGGQDLKSSNDSSKEKASEKKQERSIRYGTW